MHAYRRPRLVAACCSACAYVNLQANVFMEDVAMLLADDKGAASSSPSARTATLVEFLDKGRVRHGGEQVVFTRLRVGGSLVDAKGVPAVQHGSRTAGRAAHRRGLFALGARARARPRRGADLLEPGSARRIDDLAVVLDRVAVEGHGPPASRRDVRRAGNAPRPPQFARRLAAAGDASPPPSIEDAAP